jgi:hypothetical protein
MPYRLNPANKKIVQVKRPYGWTTAPGGRHGSVEEAKDHLTALLANVEHAPIPKKKKK